jgi:hypothetical protein
VLFESIDLGADSPSKTGFSAHKGRCIKGLFDKKPLIKKSINVDFVLFTAPFYTSNFIKSSANL